MNLNFYAPVNNLGYGICGINILKELIKLDINVSYFPIGQPQISNPEDIKYVQQGIQNAHFYSINAPVIKLWHQHSLSITINSYAKYFAYPIFELNKFSEIELHHLNNVDEIIVPTQWAKTVIKNNHINKLTHICPFGVDKSIFYPITPKQNNVCSFLLIGKTEIRKSHDLIKDIFLDLFEDNKEVELWLSIFNPFLSQEEQQDWYDYFQHPQIKLFNRVNTSEEICNLIRQSTCYLAISKAEGWNMCLLEALAVGKPAIVTNCTGHTEYTNKENSMLVEMDELEDAFDSQFFFGQGQWYSVGENQIKQIKGYMLEVYNKWKNKENLFNEEGVKTGQEYSWKRTAERLIDIVKKT